MAAPDIHLRTVQQRIAQVNPGLSVLIVKALALVASIKYDSFPSIKNLLESIDQNDKPILLNWLVFDGKSALAYCIENNKLDLATLLLFHGASTNFKLKVEEENLASSLQKALYHAQIRKNIITQDNDDNPLTLLCTESSLFNNIISLCETKGPYQHLDRQIIAEALVCFNLIVSGPPKFCNIRVNSNSLTPLTQEIKNDTRRFALLLLD